MEIPVHAFLVFRLATLAILLQMVSLAQPARLNPTSFQEDVRSGVPVGGSQMVGLVVLDDNGQVQPDTLNVRLPTIPLVIVRVRIHSLDGRYEAFITYHPSQLANTVCLLSIPTRHSDLWRAFSKSNVAVLVDGDAQAGGSALILPARWSVPKPNAKVMAFINKGSATTARFVSSADPGQRGSNCVEIDSDSAVVYNMQCDLTPLLRDNECGGRLRLL